jgi:hypothetical protein
MFFLSFNFFYVCPEPVLANTRFVSISWRKNGARRTFLRAERVGCHPSRCERPVVVGALVASEIDEVVPGATFQISAQNGATTQCESGRYLIYTNAGRSRYLMSV